MSCYIGFLFLSCTVRTCCILAVVLLEERYIIRRAMFLFLATIDKGDDSNINMFNPLSCF
jgi:hypothetical protein